MSHEKLKELADKRDNALKAAGEVKADLTHEDAGKRADAEAKFAPAWADFEKYEKEHDELKVRMDVEAARNTKYEEAAARMSGNRGASEAARAPVVRDVYSPGELEQDDKVYSRAFWDSIIFGTDMVPSTREVLARGNVQLRARMVDELREAGVRVTRALLTASGSGANVVPTTLLDAIIVYAAGSMPYNGMGGDATPASFYQTPDAGPFELPNIDDTANSADARTAAEEATAYTGAADPSPAKLTLNALKTDSGVIDLAEALLMSDVVGLEDTVGRLMAIRVSRRFNHTVYTQFTGAGGIAAAQTIAATGTAIVTVDEMEELITDSLPEQAQTSPRLGVMFGSKVRSQLYRERGTGGIKTWQEGVGGAIAGPPTQIAGARVWLNEQFPAPATGAVAAIAGDFMHSHVRVANGGVDVRRSVPGGYGFENDVIGVKAVLWADHGFTHLAKAFVELNFG